MGGRLGDLETKRDAAMGARMLLTELIAKKREEGEHELADKLEPIKERLSFSPLEEIPDEVHAVYAAHYAGERLSVLYATSPRSRKPN